MGLGRALLSAAGQFPDTRHRQVLWRPVRRVSPRLQSILQRGLLDARTLLLPLQLSGIIWEVIARETSKDAVFMEMRGRKGGEKKRSLDCIDDK